MHKNNKRSWKIRVENGFERLGFSMGNHPWWWLMCCLLVVAAMSSQLTRLEKDTSIESYLEKNSADIQLYDRFKETFGRDEIFIISLEVGDIYTQTFATQLHALQRELEDEVPYVDKVDSLANARYTHGADDTLYVEELLPETLPTDPEELAKLQRYAANSENYKNFLISADGHMLSILVRLDSYIYSKDKNGELKRSYIGEDENLEAYTKIREILEPYRGVLSDDIRVTGSIPLATTMAKILERDFSVFSGLANLLIGILLFVIFRRLSGVFMPLIIMSLDAIELGCEESIWDRDSDIRTEGK